MAAAKRSKSFASEVPDTGPGTIQLLAHTALDRAAYTTLVTFGCHAWHVESADFSAKQVWAALRKRPRLVLCIADTAVIDVVQALEFVQRLAPEARVIVVSIAEDAAHVALWGNCRFDGYVAKERPRDELFAAIHAVAEGGKWISAEIQVHLERGRQAAAMPTRLSRREAELLPLLARGLPLREAASQMGICYKTADSYRTSLLRKLGVRDRVELARYAIRHQLIVP